MTHYTYADYEKLPEGAPYHPPPKLNDKSLIHFPSLKPATHFLYPWATLRQKMS